MTEPIFEIVTKKKVNSVKTKQKNEGSYHNIHQNYVSFSYGYYTQIFIKRIVEKAQSKHDKLLKFEMRKLLREYVKKYLMTDLQLIYFAYFANLHDWNFDHPLIIEVTSQKQSNTDLNQINKFKLFINLVSFFVKSYVGAKQQLTAIIDFQLENMPLFLPVYKIWIQQNPKKLFQISPRELNQIYTQHSQNCSKKIVRKDYNQMVDKILDLSTTYTIIPTKQKKISPKKNQKPVQREAHVPSPPKRFTRNSDLSFLQNSFRLDFSDLRSNKKESIIIAGLSNISQNHQKGEKKPNQKSQEPKKLISLNKKKKINSSQVNDAAKTFFINKDANLSMEDIKKNQNSLKDINPASFLEMNMLSSRIQNLPFNYRNNSNIFGPSTLF